MINLHKIFASCSWRNTNSKYCNKMPTSCHFRDCKALLGYAHCKKRYSKCWPL